MNPRMRQEDSGLHGTQGVGTQACDPHPNGEPAVAGKMSSKL